jgi:ATP-dependent Clp protease ATP-binding subunit ClpA
MSNVDYEKMFNDDLISKLATLDDEINGVIKGQEHIVPRITTVLKRGEHGVTEPGRPRGCFLFCGPTGTGKTEITKTFTKILFGHQDEMIRFDMSEYQNKDQLERLIGNTSGWHGLLGEALLKNEKDGKKGGVLLFDEMEKGHKDILDIFLQMMDDARVTTGDGYTHSLKNYYIILTSNVGSEKVMEAKKMKFAQIEKAVKLALAAENFRPEFLGRFNEILVFKSLDYDVIREIGILNINRVTHNQITQFDERGFPIELKIDPSVIELCVMKGSNRKLGARPMRNYVEKAVQDAIVDCLQNRQVPSGNLIAEDGILKIVPEK